MRWYKADLHVHSVLSPCGGLEMAPREVMKTARDKGLDIIAITDHNSCANLEVYAAFARKFGLHYINGIEIQSAEEIHLIALFQNGEQACSFGAELYDSLLPIKNDPEYFGDQVIIDENNNIKGFVEKALINSSKWYLDEVVQKIKNYNGFYFPAHVDVESYSILGQLGFIPPHSNIGALGITAKCDVKAFLQAHPELQKYALIRNSDAHYLRDVASGYSQFYLQKPTLAEIILACKKQAGREIKY